MPLKLKVLKHRFTISLEAEAPNETDRWATIYDQYGWTVIRSSPMGGWNAIRIDQEFELQEVGILLQLLQPLAAAKVPIMAYSTYKTDYVFVNSQKLPLALVALQEAGHEVSQA